MSNNLLSLTLAAKSEINVNKSITRAVSHMISSSVADDNDDDIYICADIIRSNRISATIAMDTARRTLGNLYG